MIYNEEKTIVYVGGWKNGLRDGYGQMKYATGNSYEGEWKAGKKCGRGVMVWREVDEVYTGDWANDLPHGYGEHIWGDGGSKSLAKHTCNIYRGEWVEGLRHGYGTFFYANGSQYTGSFPKSLFFYLKIRIQTLLNVPLFVCILSSHGTSQRLLGKQPEAWRRSIYPR